ncbi:MAG TPA: glutamate synthase subunit alpha, partial [Amycolatopsis sp.]|nr:glutamate synthase subunit alpha [Amycolatopsis sp.]
MGEVLRSAQVRELEKHGLYRGEYEHDACGVAFVADLKGRRDHAIVAKALVALRNLEHRGARGAEPDTGDGAGLLIQIPDEFYREVVDFELPEAGAYAVGTAFLPQEEKRRGRAMTTIERIAAEEDMQVLGWRELPVHTEHVGPTAAETMPHLTQLFLAGRRSDQGNRTGLALERAAFCVRKRAEHELLDDEVYFPSLSSRTIVYKGMLTEGQVPKFFDDLTD